MYNSSESHQVAYSLSALSDTLFTMMKSKSLGNITITELCSKAGVCRKTFYRNCFTITDLIDYTAEKYIRELITTVDWSCQLPEVLYGNFFKFWYGRREFLQILNKQNMFSHFCELFTRICRNETEYDFLNQFLNNKTDPETLKQFHHAFIVGGLCQILKEWTAGSFKTSIDELVAVTCHLVPEH